MLVVPCEKNTKFLIQNEVKLTRPIFFQPDPTYYAGRKLLTQVGALIEVLNMKTNLKSKTN